jgi:hypothetical protein
MFIVLGKLLFSKRLYAVSLVLPGEYRVPGVRGWILG